MIKTSTETTDNYILKHPNKIQLDRMLVDRHSHWAKEFDYFSFKDLVKERDGLEPYQDNINRWILVKVDNEHNIDLLSHLETFVRKVYYHHPKLGYKKGDMYFISSLFTPEEKRGKGYANILFKKMLDNVKDKDNALGSILFSSIGTYYERFGYKPYSPYKLIIDCEPHITKANPKVKYLTISEIEEISEWDCNQMEQEISSLSPNEVPSSGILAIEANFSMYKRFWNKTMRFCEEFGVKPFILFGAVYQGENDNEKEFIIWDYNLQNEQIIILRHRLNKYAPELLDAALDIAKEFGFINISALNLHPDLIKGSQIERYSKWIIDEASLPYATLFNENQNECQPEWQGIQTYSWV